MLVISNWPRASRLSDFEINRAITPWIVLHSVQLLLLIIIVIIIIIIMPQTFLRLFFTALLCNIINTVLCKSNANEFRRNSCFSKKFRLKRYFNEISLHFRDTYCFDCGRRGGLMVSALDSGVSGPGLSSGRGHCVVFLGKTLYSHSPSLHPGV